MRVNYLHQYFTLPTEAGGTRSYEFARRWIANGKQVRIITSAYGLPDEFRNRREIVRTTLAGIPISVIPTPYSPYMSYAQRIRAFVSFAAASAREAMRQSANVIYATSTPLTIAIPGIVGKLTQRIPLVMEIRDLWPEVPIAMGALGNPVLRQAARALEWSAYHAAAHVVALSPNMARGVMRRGIPENRVTVVPNSSDIDFFSVPPETGNPVRERLGLAPDQPLIVYTGAFGYVNGVTYLVEMAAHMRDIDSGVAFLLVGDGVERQQVYERARARGVLDQSLWIWEAVPKTEMPAILAAATVATSTVIPKEALWNNSANKFFDALAAGRPVAINHGGWLAELLRDNHAGVVLPPEDTAQAARDLAQFVRDPARLERGRAAAAHLAREQFNRDNLSRQVETILEQVTAKS